MPQTLVFKGFVALFCLFPLFLFYCSLYPKVFKLHTFISSSAGKIVHFRLAYRFFARSNPSSTTSNLYLHSKYKVFVPTFK